MRVFVGRFSHLPNLLYYLRGRPGGPPYPVGGPLGGFQKEPTFPIYNITFMTGQVGRHIQWAVRWGNRKRAGLGSIRAGPYKVQLGCVSQTLTFVRRSDTCSDVNSSSRGGEIGVDGVN